MTSSSNDNSNHHPDCMCRKCQTSIADNQPVTVSPSQKQIKPQSISKRMPLTGLIQRGILATLVLVGLAGIGVASSKLIFTGSEETLANLDLVPTSTSSSVLTSTPLSVPTAESDDTELADIEELKKSVVNIMVDTGYGGTGTILSSDGLVLTNYHVISGSSQITVFASDITGSYESVPARLLGANSDYDLAVIQLADNQIRTYRKSKIGSVKNSSIGDEVIAIGYPSETLRIVRGSITGISNDGITDSVFHDAQIQDGYSGGPLFSPSGLVIGINTFTLDDLEFGLETISQAISIDEASSKFMDLKNGDMSIDPAAAFVSEAYEADSIPMLTEIIEDYPFSATAYYHRADLFIRKDYFQKAIDDVDNALSFVTTSNPWRARFYELRAYSYGWLGLLNKSIEDAGQAIEIEPRYVDAYITRSESYIESESFGLAIQDLNKAIELGGPDNGYAYHTRGVVFEGLDMYKEAAQDFDKAKERGFDLAAQLAAQIIAKNSVVAPTPTPIPTPTPAPSFGLTANQWQNTLIEIDSHKEMIWNASGIDSNMNARARKVLSDVEKKFRLQYNIEAVNPRSKWYVGIKLVESKNPLDVNSKYDSYLQPPDIYLWSSEDWGTKIRATFDNLYHGPLPSSNVNSSVPAHFLMAREFWIAMVDNDYIVREWIIIQGSTGFNPIMASYMPMEVARSVDRWLLDNPDSSLFEEWALREFSW